MGYYVYVWARFVLRRYLSLVITQIHVASDMFRLQLVGVGVGPVGIRVVTAHGRRCASWWFLSGREGADLRS